MRKERRNEKEIRIDLYRWFGAMEKEKPRERSVMDFKRKAYSGCTIRKKGEVEE